MKKIVMILLVLIHALYGEKLEVTAKKFEADEKKHISILSGNVLIQKGQDSIRCEKLIIEFDEKNKPKLYMTQGGVNFDIHTDKQHFIGRADRLSYTPANKLYTMSGNVHIKEQKNDQTLSGDEITIDRASGKATINGTDSRPVKLIFDVQE